MPTDILVINMTPTEKNLTVLRAIGSTTRLKILTLLEKDSRGKGTPVQDISNGLGMKHSAISHQLAVLSGAGVVASTKKGRFELYVFAKTPEAQTARKILRAMR